MAEKTAGREVRKRFVGGWREVQGQKFLRRWTRKYRNDGGGNVYEEKMLEYIDLYGRIV